MPTTRKRRSTSRSRSAKSSSSSSSSSACEAKPRKKRKKQRNLKKEKEKVQRRTKKIEKRGGKEQEEQEGKEKEEQKEHKVKGTPMSIGRRLLRLPKDCVRARMIRRPSARNKSPYVADVMLEGEKREAIAHVPSMDLGGKCREGALMLLKPARDRKGQLVGPDAVSKKYGTPKCEFITQLVYCDEPENTSLRTGPGCWVGAHPRIGEELAAVMIEGGVVNSAIGAGEGEVLGIEREVRGIAGPHSRADFVLAHGLDDGGGRGKPRRRTVLEVKTVVDTDYHWETPPQRKKCVYLGKAYGGESFPGTAAMATNSPATNKSKEKTKDGKRMKTEKRLKSGKGKGKGKGKKEEGEECAKNEGKGRRYFRAAIFPWGERRGQKGPDGEKVVSARAIKHVDELAQLAERSRLQEGEGEGEGGGRESASSSSIRGGGGGGGGGGAEVEALGAALLFVVSREDADLFRPNAEACPSFAKHVANARASGVSVVAHRVRWGKGKDEGVAFYDGELGVEF